MTLWGSKTFYPILLLIVGVIRQREIFKHWISTTRWLKNDKVKYFDPLIYSDLWYYRQQNRKIKGSALIKLLKFSCCGGVAPLPSTSRTSKPHLLLARPPTRWWALFAHFFGREISHRLRHDSFPKPEFFSNWWKLVNLKKLCLCFFLSFLWRYTLIQSLMRTPGRVAELCSLGALKYLPIKFKALCVALCY